MVLLSTDSMSTFGSAELRFHLVDFVGMRDVGAGDFGAASTTFLKSLGTIPPPSDKMVLRDALIDILDVVS